jgi:pimeloyl-ACP methyl ester carboxylesterase
VESVDRGVIYSQVIDDGHNGPWLVMVHGFTHNSDYFEVHVSEFRKDFRILLTDLRGHGQSGYAEGPYGIEEYADDILSILDGAGVKEAHYWGTHTGSAVGLVMALRCPERFLSLVLEGTFLPGFSMPRTEELIVRARTIARSQGVEAALEDWFDHADWFSYIREHWQVCRAKEHRAMLAKFSGTPLLSERIPRQVEPVVERLKDIKRPVLVYNGEYDMKDFKQAALCLEGKLPNVQREEILEAGGFPAWENPQAVGALVSGFLNGLAR